MLLFQFASCRIGKDRQRKGGLHASPNALPYEGAAFNHRDESISFCAVSFEATNFLGALASFQRRCQRQSVFGWKTIEIAAHGQILLVTPTTQRIRWITLRTRNKTPADHDGLGAFEPGGRRGGLARRQPVSIYTQTEHWASCYFEP